MGSMRNALSSRLTCSAGLLTITLALALLALSVNLAHAQQRGQSVRHETRPQRPFGQVIAELRPVAVEQIVASARSPHAMLRANAIEAAQPMKDRVRPIAQLALEDGNPGVRFAALATIGKLRLTDLAPAVARHLDDRSPSVRAAALFAQRVCGANNDISPMAAMISSQDVGLRGNVALLLGMMGDRSAAPMVKDLARTPLKKSSAVQVAIVNIQVAEALVKLGDDEALDAIRSGAYSQFDEVRVLSVQMMGRMGDRRMERALVEFLKTPPVELQLAAAESLMRLGHKDGLRIALESSASALPTVRSQAALTLGLFSEAEAAEALGRLLKDESEAVRLAAAAAVINGPVAPRRGVD